MELRVQALSFKTLYDWYPGTLRTTHLKWISPDQYINLTFWFFMCTTMNLCKMRHENVLNLNYFLFLSVGLNGDLILLKSLPALATKVDIFLNFLQAGLRKLMAKMRSKHKPLYFSVFQFAIFYICKCNKWLTQCIFLLKGP